LLPILQGAAGGVDVNQLLGQAVGGGVPAPSSPPSLELLRTPWPASRPSDPPSNQRLGNSCPEPTDCPLSGVKRTLCGHVLMSAFDPTQTFAVWERWISRTSNTGQSGRAMQRARWVARPIVIC
jgi:hypothetical protein